jgi:hypothetical protein
MVRFVAQSGAPDLWASHSELGACQAWLREGLALVTNDDPDEVAERKEITPGVWRFDMRMRGTIIRRDDGRLVAAATGGRSGVRLRDWFPAAVLQALRAGRCRVRTCTARVCGRLFLVSHARKRYCSKACSQAIRTRAYRARHPEHVRRWQRAARARARQPAPR